jgi:hypothetical protein
MDKRQAAFAPADGAKKKKKKKNETWGYSDGRKTLLAWLDSGQVPLEPDESDGQRFFEHEEFVKFGEKDWLKRLAACRKIAGAKLKRAERDGNYHANFLQKNGPSNTENAFGRKNWRGSLAEAKLAEDMKEGVHLQYESPSAFRASNPIYQEFNKQRFRGRIEQQNRATKFQNYVAVKRAEKPG